MNNSNQHITLEILLKSLENDFDKVERARIFQSLKDTEPTDDALIGAKMLLEEKVHPEQLIDRVTTPQGCTIVGLNEMEHNGFSSSLIKGIKTSLKQIKG